MPIIAIKTFFEPISKIPAMSMVELPDGQRVQYHGMEGDHARIKNADGGISSATPDLQAKYICSLIDYDSLAYV